MTDHVPGDGQWKQKYFAQLEKFEREEKQWRDTEDVLKRTLSRVSLAAEGLTADLDEQLGRLREALRHHADSGSLHGPLQQLSDALLALEGRGGKRADRSPARSWEAMLEQVRWPRELRRDAKKLRKKLSSVRYASELAPLLIEVQTLIARGLCDEPEEDASQSTGFLAGLLGSVRSKPRNANTATLTDPGVAPDVISIADGVALVEPLMDLVEARFGEAHDTTLQMTERMKRVAALGELRVFVTDLARALASTHGDNPISPQASTQSADAAQTPNNLMIALLDRLSLPPDLDLRVTSLREQLLLPVPGDRWPHLLQGVCDLVADMRRKVQREKEDLEKFLAQLTTRLQELDEKVQGTASEREASLRHGQVLDMAVKAQVSGIANSMEDADSLDELKRSIQDRLEEIRRHMDAYRDAEEDRHRQADDRAKMLTRRLQELEQETESLRERVRDQRSQALRDTLTGIHNRLAYDERVEQEYLRWKRFQEPVTIMVWDVDNFKTVNDTYGHKAGDKVLVAIAKLLASQIRETDFIARYGGEEFVIIAPGTDAATALSVAEKLRISVEQKNFRHHDVPVPVTISCGIAEFRNHETPDTVFEKADEALYRAKQAGRNRCIVASGA